MANFLLLADMLGSIACSLFAFADVGESLFKLFVDRPHFASLAWIDLLVSLEEARRGNRVLRDLRSTSLRMTQSGSVTMKQGASAAAVQERKAAVNY